MLTKIVGKLQGASLAQINKIIDKVFPEVSTNFTLAEILEYAKDAFDYKLGETIGFPFDKTTDTLANIGSVVIPVTLDKNVEQLHKFFYGEGDTYSPSSTVNTISGKIVAKAGDRQADTDEASQGVMQQPDESYTGGGTSGGTKTHLPAARVAAPVAAEAASRLLRPLPRQPYAGARPAAAAWSR